ncbi:gamma-glutamyltransferase [Reyranella sp.]|uniref:gamma-glutamyltransferase n=1 Tax=Reyranella sp. TaxID=1929291 RepID=UPI0035244EE3
MAMRLNTGSTGCKQARNARRPRQLRSLALVGLLLLSACGRSETDRTSDAAENAANPAGRPPGQRGLSGIFRGATFAAVSADESRAAEVGREVLLGGGNATDAAIAMYFALAVTLPSASGLGASGACVVHNSKNQKAESFVFAPVAAPGPINGVSFTVPSSVRAMTLMHVRHGQLRWEQVVSPGERLARFGVPVSRALARDLQAGGATLSGDREALRVFGKAGGGLLSEGDRWVQAELAGTLGTIRARGGVDFFQGTFARGLSDQVSQMGGSLPLEALRNAVPQAGPPAGEAYGRQRIYVAPPPMAGASALAGWRGQAPGGGAPVDSGGFAGLAAVDSKGGAAACSLSMGQVFGARVVVHGTGILLGAPTPDAASVSPMIIAYPSSGEFTFAGAGGGAATAAQATGAVARATIEAGQSVASVLAARRGQGGYVNAIACPSGLRSSAATCQGGIDPAGAGLALIAVER